MSIVALSPVAPEPLSPMVTSLTPVSPGLDPNTCASDGDASAGPGPSRGSLCGGGPHAGLESSRRSEKPPPLHAGADWKVVLHLPEIEKWLRATSNRVTQLTHSVGQDGSNRHVDVHLVQLKDICEDISDHVEQIHALLETEFSLKLLSYSVNIIVDIRTVQLLWHQLRVSVLVLKERLLQGLQDSNGNYTRQTDILQAFRPEQHQTRLDDLTEVDACGQLTIRCSQDYFSLDCGITAFELSDYSPSDEPEARGAEPGDGGPSQKQDLDTDPDCEVTTPTLSELPTMLCGVSSHAESTKRPLQGVSHSTDVSPTHPSLPKRAALFFSGDSSGRAVGKAGLLPELHFQAELSRSTPSLTEAPDRSKFWLELDSVYPGNVSQSYENLQVMNGRNLQRNRVSSRQEGRSEGRAQRPLTDQRKSSGAGLTQNGPLPLQDAPSQDETLEPKYRMQEEMHTHSEDDSGSSLPSPMREHPISSDVEASGEESDPRPPPGRTAVWILKHQGLKVSSNASPDRQHWYGSDEFLALPSQLRKTEMLAMKLESLAQSIPPRPCDPTVEGLQDVDDWDLTELNPEWDVGAGRDAVPSPPPPLLPYRQNLASRFSPTSSSDIAPSLDESIESGPLSDLQSEEEEGRRSADCCLEPTPSLVNGQGSALQRLVEDIQSRDTDPDVWKKIECFVQQLDGFISWLQEALDSTENWMQPRQDVDSLRIYLDTHLGFKLSVDSHSALKESIMETGRALLPVITSQQSGLKDILHMVSSQWEQLQRQIRRQHGWMLRAVRCVQARLLYSSQSRELFAAVGNSSTNPQAPCPADGLKYGAQRAALEQMALTLSGLHYPATASRGHCGQPAGSGSLQELEVEYQELWDWLMDMDAMVTDSHQLMMSEEQRHHLFQSSRAELMTMESRKSSLLGRVDVLRRSGLDLPTDLHGKLHRLTHTWRQLENLLSEQSASGPSQQNPSAGAKRLPVGSPHSALSPLTSSLLEQLEARIKELKAWLRDTELLIFNSCLRQDKDASEQLHSFKCLSSEVRARRRGVSSVLKLCQKLLQHSQSGPVTEVGPEAEQHREALQLLSINLERRWEAIVMQALQWQNRLKRELGDQQVPGNFLEAGLVDLHHIGAASVDPMVPDESWEWDETDMTIAEPEPEPQQVPEPILTHDPPPETALGPEMRGESSEAPTGISPPTVYQVYSLHNVEFYKQPQFPHAPLSLRKVTSGKRKQQLLLKSLSKDSSFSSIESLPDLPASIAGLEGGRGSGQSAGSRPSECESGIVSDTGDAEMTTNSENQEVEEEDDRREKGWRSDEGERRRRHSRGGGQAVEILINGRGILTPADSDSDLEVERPFMSHCDVTALTKVDPVTLETPALSRRASSPVLSQGSSLESLLALGVELFPKDALQRSASLESNLAPEETRGSLVSRGKLLPEPNREGEGAGELSRRTLDLLKRLENIQTPLTTKMTRSVSDMTLRSSSPQRSLLTASPSLGGRHSPLSLLSGSSRRGPPSLIYESSATASLTELSSNEDSGSEDLVMLQKQQRVFLDASTAVNANASCYRSRGRGTEDADTSLSMVVNVSCTDEDEDDSDLLSSSTLTLTEEELGVQDGEDGEEERLSGASSGNDDEELEASYVLGLEYMKRELQSWIRSPRSSSKTEAGLRDELQCGSHLSSTFTALPPNPEQHCFTNSSNKRLKRGEREQEEENKKNATRSYISQFVDDMDNGNMEQSCLKTKDEDAEFLRQESSVFTKKGDSNRESFSSKPLSSPFLSKCASSLVGQLQGELPCHSSSVPSPPSLSPVDDCTSHEALQVSRSFPGGRKAITTQEKFKFSSFVTEETRREVRDKKSSLPPRRRSGSVSSCCSRAFATGDATKDDVHHFVMEIIDLTSLALKSKGSRPEETEQQESSRSKPDQGPAPLAQIRDKVLEHSHRPLHLRKGDFYSYLALSSHDSDCGEVSQCSEDKSSTPAPYSIPAAQGLESPSPEQRVRASSSAPVSPRCTSSLDSLSLPPSPDIRDEEPLFAACTEEVYLGPPLCYSMVLTKRPQSFCPSPPGADGGQCLEAPSSLQEPRYSSFKPSNANPPGAPPLSSGAGEEKRGEDLRLLCDVARGEVTVAASVGVLQEERSRNEGPPYLNPRARVAPIDSSAAECLADTKTLESNMGAVMTKISVCSSATNPSKEPAATATRINPKINCSAMSEADREEGERAGGQAKPEDGRRGQNGSQQEAEAAEQVRSQSAPHHGPALSRSHASGRRPSSSAGTVSRLPTAAAGASRIQL